MRIAGGTFPARSRNLVGKDKGHEFKVWQRAPRLHLDGCAGLRRRRRFQADPEVLHLSFPPRKLGLHRNRSTDSITQVAY